MECIGDACYFAATADSGIEVLTIASLQAEPDSPNARIVPVGQRHGIGLAQATDHGELAPGERYSAAAYGGWLEYSAFGIVGVEYIGGEFNNWGNLFSYSHGKGSGSNPAAGTATWTGIVMGVDVSLSEAAGNTIQGQARIDFDLRGGAVPTIGGSPTYWPTVDITFTQMYDIDAGTRKSDIHWDGVRVENGSFSGSDLVSGSIDGRLYGPNHEEVGGTFESYVYYDIIGAFGASRD